jgi:hypothetical protein
VGAQSSCALSNEDSLTRKSGLAAGVPLCLVEEACHPALCISSFKQRVAAGLSRHACCQHADSACCF